MLFLTRVVPHEFKRHFHGDLVCIEGGCMLAIASMPFEVGFRPRLVMVCPNTQRRCILQLVQIVQTTVHICEVHRDVCV